MPRFLMFLQIIFYLSYLQPCAGFKLLKDLSYSIIKSRWSLLAALAAALIIFFWSRAGRLKKVMSLIFSLVFIFLNIMFNLLIIT